MSYSAEEIMQLPEPEEHGLQQYKQRVALTHERWLHADSNPKTAMSVFWNVDPGARQWLKENKNRNASAKELYAIGLKNDVWMFNWCLKHTWEPSIAKKEGKHEA